MNAVAPGRGFWPEIILGLGLSLASAAVFSALRPLLGSTDALRLVLLGCAAIYTLWTLRCAEAKVGRLLSIAGLGVIALALLIWNPGLWAWLLGLTGFAWLLRALYRHDSLLAAASDAGLSMLALAAGVASLQHTHSLWIGLWCVFLTQALHHTIPHGWGARAQAGSSTSAHNTPFDQAYRASEAAFSRLASRR